MRSLCYSYFVLAVGRSMPVRRRMVSEVPLLHERHMLLCEVLYTYRRQLPAVCVEWHVVEPILI
jgi:hypothetical protein